MSSDPQSEISFARIEKSKANGSNEFRCGGAVYFDNTSELVLTHTIIRDNYASYDGGGIFNKGSLEIKNSLFFLFLNILIY